MTDVARKPDETLPPLVPESYLVLREGASWREIYRLPSNGELITLGRDPGNRIVLSDDRCSRTHCAIFYEQPAWLIRDLGSRNGTTVNGVLVNGSTPLAEGVVIRLGATELLFTGELSRPMDVVPNGSNSPTREATSAELAADTDSTTNPVILDRKSRPRFISESALADEAGGSVSLRETFATLYRLIVGMMSAGDTKQVCETLLGGLLPAIGADIGAVLLFPEDIQERTHPGNLRIVAYRAPEQSPYRRVSTKLSTAVLREGQAILARDLSNSGSPTEYGSLREIEATSVICAPVRREGHVHGVLHIYSRQANRQLDADALELTLAVGDHLATILDTLKQKESLTASLRRAEDQNKSLSQLLEIESDLVGDSRRMRELRDSIARVAVSDATVLIRGESGVGKELVSRAVHFNSKRREGPFVCVNCAALTETLLESELFGHEKGAFTGATERKAGKFEQADCGTLFLDEVGEMSPSIQTKFLRVLEGHCFERVGGHTSIHVDVRIVAATNRNLEAAVEKGDFRRDLLYRLQVIEIHVPQLAEHAEDVPLLARHLLDRACRRLGRPAMELTEDAIDKLRAYPWPGNVRELRNVVERAAVLHQGDLITAAELLFTPQIGPAAAKVEPASAEDGPVSLDELERRHILRTLETTNGNKRETARVLGINRSTLDRKLQKYDL
ncbi:MAG: sigma 54-interacting transcriptional regulator [Planctomycetaceae bacterium]|nr:sigma 54-interacting transcriptional regulator [Planctomycetaceae bacterium]